MGDGGWGGFKDKKTGAVFSSEMEMHATLSTEAARSALINKGTALDRGGNRGLKAYEVVRFAIVSSGKGTTVPRRPWARGEVQKKLWRVRTGGRVGDARGDKTCGREGCKEGCEPDGRRE